MRAAIKYLLSLLIAILPITATCQSEVMSREQQMKLAHYSPEMFASVYRAYQGPRTTKYTPAPKGYRPVFLSHYGRHGSRYLIDDDKYRFLLSQLEGKALTETGEELLRRVRICWQQAEGRGGDLTPLGEQQHRQIAERMAGQFPTLFKGEQAITVLSSTTPRCIISMTAFCERLKEHNPRLQLSRDVCEKNMPTLTCIRTELQQLLKTDTPARLTFETYRLKTLHPQTFLNRIYQQPDSALLQMEAAEGGYQFLEQLFQLAQDMQDCGHPTELLSFFTTDELYSIWSVKNLQMYLGNGDAPQNEGKASRSANDLWQSIIDDADQALAQHRGGATLRFGHDTSLSRLVTRLGIAECCPREADPERVALRWQDFNTIPMAANLQIIFYQNRQGHTLIRLLLNENEVHLPLKAMGDVFYDWEEVKRSINSVSPTDLEINN